MVCVIYVNRCKPRYFGAAEMTNFVCCCKASMTAVVKNDKGQSCLVRVPKTRSSCSDYGQNGQFPRGKGGR